MRVLIVYGTKRGGTAGLAEMIGEELDEAGLETAVCPARRAAFVEEFDAVVIAGALYTNRWHRDARRFAKRNQAVLRDRPVWLVASGPLDDSALEGEIQPVRHVRRTMAAIDARGEVTFGGRLEPDATGFPARAMAKKMAGDWRDRAHVRQWVAEIVAELADLEPVAGTS